MGYESRHAGHYNRRKSVQGLSLRVPPREPPAVGTGLLPGDPTRWGRVAGDLTTGRGSRPVPDRRGARGYRFPPEPGAGVEALAASRVLPNGDGAAYVFTQFQTPG